MPENWSDFFDEVKAFIKPFGQISVVLFFSLLPIFLTAVNIVSHDEEKFFSTEVLNLLESGSIFIYVSAFLAPYFYSLFFEGGFRTRLYVMAILSLALWALVMGALLYSGFVSRLWGGEKFPHYIELSVLIPSLITWHYTLYGSVGDSTSDDSQRSMNDAIRKAVNER